MAQRRCGARVVRVLLGMPVLSKTRAGWGSIHNMSSPQNCLRKGGFYSPPSRAIVCAQSKAPRRLLFPCVLRSHPPGARNRLPPPLGRLLVTMMVARQEGSLVRPEACGNVRRSTTPVRFRRFSNTHRWRTPDAFPPRFLRRRRSTDGDGTDARK